jgi:hypothetical protein
VSEREGDGGPEGLEELLLRKLRGVEQGLGRDVERAVPAWLRETPGESRWAVSFTIVVAMALQALLPDRFAVQPRWVLLGLQVVLLAGVVVANPIRIERPSTLGRTASLGLTLLFSVANAWSAGRLVVALVNGTAGDKAAPLLGSGAAIWLTNVAVFALWYWEFDRGGPVTRARGTRPYPDFLFSQMTVPELVPPEWEPTFTDYFYLSFTNATAFSPTDVMPLTRWAKLTMMAQSAVSLVAVALVVARAVNVLK